MKVTEPDVIKSGERDLIESIKDDLDWDTIKEIFIQRIKSASFDLNKDSSLSFDVSGGEIIVHKGEIAFRVDFELRTAMSIMFDRKGNYIPNANQHLDREYISDKDKTGNSGVQLLEVESSDGVEIIDNIDSLEDEDILGDITDEQDLGELDPIADFNELNETEEELDPIADLNELNKSDDDIEDILKESRDFWEK